MSSPLFRLFLAFSFLAVNLVSAQRVPTAPSEIYFGGTAIILNPAAQQRLQVEIAALYADPVALRNAIEQLQYVESVLGPMLEERLLPADFRYLCLPLRTSNGGYWALDARRASTLNLRVDNAVDERLNVASSSEAVLDELSSLHNRQPNWVRVMLEYATGQRPPILTGQSAGTGLANDPVQLAIDSPTLVWTTLARKLVFEREPSSMRPADPLLLYDYRQGRGKSLAAIARELGIAQTRLVPFNEWLRTRVIPSDKDYPVLIRLTTSEYLTVRRQVNADTQPLQSTPAGLRPDMGFPVLRKLTAQSGRDPITRQEAIFYEINDLKGIQAQPCDNVITLAYYGNLSTKEFLTINDMTDRDLVRSGEIYYLEPKAKKAKIPFHVVQAGQTLRDISTMYGVRVKSLLGYNRMETNQRLQAGRILWLREKRPASAPVEYQLVPAQPPTPEPTVAQRRLTREDEESVIDSPPPPYWQQISPDSVESPRDRPKSPVPSVTDESPTGNAATGVAYHLVREGDTYSGIAQLYNISLADLMTWNNLSYRKPLEPGRRLIVAKTTPALPAKPTETPPAVATRPAGSNHAGSLTAATATIKPTRLSRENTESIIDVDKPVSAPKPAVPPSRTSPATPARPERLMNQVRIETPKVNGRSYYYVVQRGQTVYRVALINKVRVQDVMRWNNLPSYTIEIGQRILIKK